MDAVLRTLAGLRLDGYRFGVDASDPVNSGTRYAGIMSPKAGAVLGPWRGTELYANAGLGFHSNDARVATISRDPATGDPAERVTPLVRAPSHLAADHPHRVDAGVLRLQKGAGVRRPRPADPLVIELFRRLYLSLIHI